jgi:hypothetical protein
VRQRGRRSPSRRLQGLNRCNNSGGSNRSGGLRQEIIDQGPTRPDTSQNLGRRTLCQRIFVSSLLFCVGCVMPGPPPRDLSYGQTSGHLEENFVLPVFQNGATRISQRHRRRPWPADKGRGSSLPDLPALLLRIVVFNWNEAQNGVPGANSRSLDDLFVCEGPKLRILVLSLINTGVVHLCAVRRAVYLIEFANRISKPQFQRRCTCSLTRESGACPQHVSCTHTHTHTHTHALFLAAPFDKSDPIELA